MALKKSMSNKKPGACLTMRPGLRKSLAAQTFEEPCGSIDWPRRAKPITGPEQPLRPEPRQQLLQRRPRRLQPEQPLPSWCPCRHQPLRLPERLLRQELRQADHRKLQERAQQGQQKEQASSSFCRYPKCVYKSLKSNNLASLSGDLRRGRKFIGFSAQWECQCGADGEGQHIE